MIYHNQTAIDSINESTPSPDAFYHKSTLIATSKWVNTDGWRGYTQVIPEIGYLEIEADWLTDNYADAPQGHSSREVELKTIQLERKYGDIWIIFTPTSNVFSTSYTVLVRDPDVKPLKGKTIAHKTKLFTDGDNWRVQYRATDVVTFDSDTQPHYTLNTGGWNTMTTSKRMTEALPDGWYVYRKNWIMYLHRTGLADVELKDGMEV